MTVFSICEDTSSTAAPGEERKSWRHQPVDYAALPWTQRKAARSVGRVPERGGGLGESLVYNRVHVFGQVDR